MTKQKIFEINHDNINDIYNEVVKMVGGSSYFMESTGEIYKSLDVKIPIATLGELFYFLANSDVGNGLGMKVTDRGDTFVIEFKKDGNTLSVWESFHLLTFSN